MKEKLTEILKDIRNIDWFVKIDLSIFLPVVALLFIFTAFKLMCIDIYPYTEHYASSFWHYPIMSIALILLFSKIDYRIWEKTALFIYY